MMNPNNTIDTNLLRQIFFIILILFLGIILFRELVFFLSAFLGSVTFYVIMRDRMFYLTEKRGWRPSRAAWILMLLSFFVILVPIGLLGNILYSKISYMVTHSAELLASLKKAADDIRQRDGNVELIGEELRRNVVANTIGIPLIAFIQGLVGLIGYLIIGIDEPFVWFVATCISAMLPVVGAAVIYVPLTIMLFVQGHIGRGIAMGLWGFLLIGLVDNLFRFMLNKKLGDIHPLITIFGVIAGIQLFGFIGIIFGPLLISMFLLLLRIYSTEFMLKKRETRRVK